MWFMQGSEGVERGGLLCTVSCRVSDFGEGSWRCCSTGRGILVFFFFFFFGAIVLSPGLVVALTNQERSKANCEICLFFVLLRPQHE